MTDLMVPATHRPTVPLPSDAEAVCIEKWQATRDRQRQKYLERKSRNGARNLGPFPAFRGLGTPRAKRLFFVAIEAPGYANGKPLSGYFQTRGSARKAAKRIARTHAGAQAVELVLFGSAMQRARAAQPLGAEHD